MYFIDISTVLQQSTTGVKSSLLVLCLLLRQSPTEGRWSPREAPVPDMGNAVPEGGVMVLQYSWGTGNEF